MMPNAAGWTDHVWTLRAGLLYRVPLWLQLRANPTSHWCWKLIQDIVFDAREEASNGLCSRCHGAKTVERGA